MKFCIDKLCERAGVLLPRSEFYRKADAADCLTPYCKKCVIRETRARLKRSKEDCRRFGIRERKPMALARSKFAFSLVYDAIKSGATTREEIQRITKLDWDSIGEALLELWEVKGIRIERLGENKRRLVAA